LLLRAWRGAGDDGDGRRAAVRGVGAVGRSRAEGGRAWFGAAAYAAVGAFGWGGVVHTLRVRVDGVVAGGELPGVRAGCAGVGGGGAAGDGGSRDDRGVPGGVEAGVVGVDAVRAGDGVVAHLWVRDRCCWGDAIGERWRVERSGAGVAERGPGDQHLARADFDGDVWGAGVGSLEVDGAASGRERRAGGGAGDGAGGGRTGRADGAMDRGVHGGDGRIGGLGFGVDADVVGVGGGGDVSDVCRPGVAVHMGLGGDGGVRGRHDVARSAVVAAGWGAVGDAICGDDGVAWAGAVDGGGDVLRSRSAGGGVSVRGGASEAGQAACGARQAEHAGAAIGVNECTMVGRVSSGGSGGGRGAR